VNREEQKPSIFTQESLTCALRIWEQVNISLLDIRHRLITPEDPILRYRLPASAFLFTAGRKAEILIEETSYCAENFGLCHVGKGMELSLRPMEEWLEYYLVLYRYSEPVTHKKEINRLLEQTNPFRQQYGFTPNNPVFISELLCRMYEVWKQPSPLECFYEKTAFYQLVYEIYRELEQGKVNVLQPDVVSMTKRYIDEHFRESVSIQSIASVFGISDSHLRRCFKNEYGESPQEYLTNARMLSARKLLHSSSLPIRSIATACGFPDEFYFSKLFLKTTGMTPRDYRAKIPSYRNDFSMENASSFSYNEKGQVSHGKLRKEGDVYMLKQMKNKTLAAAALSMVILLSACSNRTPVNTKGTETSPTQAAATEAIKDTETETGTRTISTVKGDIEVPANPERVIATYGMGDVLALGVKPVATYDATGTAYEKEVADLPVWASFESEDIMTYEPDLILVVNEEQYDKVSKIAPTIIIPFTELSMEERITFLGKVLNKEEAAVKILTDFNLKIEDAKKQLSEKGIMDKTFSLFEGSDNGGVWAYGDKWGRGGDLIYSHMGFKAPEIIQNEIIGKDQYRDVSLEVINEYAGDYIIFSGELNELEDNPVWQSIPAVQANHIIPIDYTLFYDIDIYSSGIQLDYLLEKLLEVSE